MPVSGLDHINIDTSKPAETIEFYNKVLGLENRPEDRPGDPLDGAWLWCGDRPIVHLGFVDTQPPSGTGALNHAAFECSDFDGTCAALDDLGITYEARRRTDRAFHQIFLSDPNGVKLELNIAH